MPFTTQTARAAGLKRAAQFTAESQAAAARCQSPDHKAMIGKRGAAVVIAKYGREFFFNQMVECHRNNPTKGEEATAAILIQLGIGFEFNAPIAGKWIVDFLVGDRNVIEFNGTMHESKYYDTARHDRKIAGLKAAGYRVLEIADKDLPNAVDLIREFLGVKYE